MWDKFGDVTVTLNNMTSNNTMGNMSSYSNTTSSGGCYSMTPYWSNMFRPASDPEYPWIGLWVALPIIGIWYWCTDQVRMWCGDTWWYCFLVFDTVALIKCGR